MVKQLICKKCILPDNFLGIELNSNGICNFCADSEYKNNNWSRKNINTDLRYKSIADWNNVIKDMKLSLGKVQYDCVLGYSGGKDSTALLDYLVKELGLSVLAVTIDTGFMTKIAKDNIKKTLNNIQVDHSMISECANTFKKLYKYLFINHTSNDTFLVRNICDFCSDLIHSIIVKESIKKNIKYVLFGYSPDQIFRYFYEIPQEEVVKNWRPKLIDNDYFDDNDRKWYLSEQDINNRKTPRILLPYHVMPYREEEIINLVETKNYIKKGNADPLLTNCNAVHAAIFYDLNRYGGILYVYQYAELVRQDPSQRKKWLRTLKIATPLILENKFKEKAVNDFFQKVELSIDKVQALIHSQLDQDPNKEKIKQNIELYKKKIRK